MLVNLSDFGENSNSVGVPLNETIVRVAHAVPFPSWPYSITRTRIGEAAVGYTECLQPLYSARPLV